MRSSNEEIYLSMGISKTVYDYGCTIEKSLRDRFDEVDSNAEYNQLKVVNAMQQHQVSEACLLGTTGYGYNDLGRDTLEAVYAATFHTEDALVRPQITCGTHALALALMSNLSPGRSHRYPPVEGIAGRIRCDLSPGGSAAGRKL